MKTPIDIKNEVEATLKSLDNWKKVEADTFFYTRISARLENKNQPKAFNWFFDLPILKPLLIVLAILLNVLSVNFLLNYNSNKDNTDFASAVSTEYMLDQSTESYLALNNE